VDPGHTNGGVVLAKWSKKAPHTVLGAWAWVLRKRVAGNVWVVTDKDGRLTECRTLNDVGGLIRESVAALGVDSYTLTLEGLYLDQMKKASRIITLAESAGEIVGPLRSGSVGPVARPKASTWRAKVLRASRLSAAAAAARAIQCAPLIATGLGELADNEHVCEALCIGYYGGVLARV
jgi:hypothetical protein